MTPDQNSALQVDFCGMHFQTPLVLLSGCVGFGDSLGYYENLWSVMNSGKTMAKFMDAMDGDDGQIIIKSKQVHSLG